MSLIRSFLAVEIGSEIKDNLHLLLTEMRSTKAQIKWVREKNLHFTVRFLGDVEKKKLLGPISDELSHSLKEVEPFLLNVSGLGVFPDLKRPRVVWAGTGSGKEQMINLHRLLTAVLQNFGFAPERRSYTPHLTLGRIKGNRNLEDLLQIVQKHEKEDFGTMRVKTLIMMESVLTPKGPIYTPVHYHHLVPDGV